VAVAMSVPPVVVVSVADDEEDDNDDDNDNWERLSPELRKIGPD